MYVERGERHHLPHFHVLYQGKGAAYRIDTAEVIGRIPSSTSAKVGGGVGGVAPRWVAGELGAVAARRATNQNCVAGI